MSNETNGAAPTEEAVEKKKGAGKGVAKSDKEQVAVLAFNILRMAKREEGRIKLEQGTHQKMKTEEFEDIDPETDKIATFVRPVLVNDEYVWVDGDECTNMHIDLNQKEFIAKLVKQDPADPKNEEKYTKYEIPQEAYVSALRRATASIKKLLVSSGKYDDEIVGDLNIKFAGGRGRGGVDISDLSELI